MDNEKEKLSVEIQKLQRQDLWRFVKAFFHHQARNSTSHAEGPPDKKRVIEASFHKLMKNWSDHLYQIKVNGKFAGIVTICDFFYSVAFSVLKDGNTLHNSMLSFGNSLDAEYHAMLHIDAM